MCDLPNHIISEEMDSDISSSELDSDLSSSDSDSCEPFEGDWTCLGCPRAISHKDWTLGDKKQLKVALYCRCDKHQYVCTLCVYNKTKESWYELFGEDHAIQDLADSRHFVMYEEGEDLVIRQDISDYDPYYVSLSDQDIFPGTFHSSSQYLFKFVNLNLERQRAYIGTYV